MDRISIARVVLGVALVVEVLGGVARAQLPRPQIPPIRPAPELVSPGVHAGGLSLPAGTVPFLDTVLRLSVEGLTPATQATLEPLRSDCFVLRPRVSYGPEPVTSDGRVQFARFGWATRSGTCHVAARLTSTARGFAARDLDFGTVTVAEPARYTVRHTWRLRDVLGFKFVTGTGTCEGTAIGIPNSYKVGIHEANDDISLVIHGGPIGTDCQFASQAWRLPQGMLLVSTTWDGATQGVCGAVGPGGLGGATALLKMTTPSLNRGAAAIVQSQIAESPTRYYSTVSADARVLTSDNVILLDANHTLASFVLPMWTRLQCGVAPHNEDRIRLTLKEMVFSGPPGLNFP